MVEHSKFGIDSSVAERLPDLFGSGQNWPELEPKFEGGSGSSFSSNTLKFKVSKPQTIQKNLLSFFNILQVHCRLNIIPTTQYLGFFIFFLGIYKFKTEYQSVPT